MKRLSTLIVPCLWLLGCATSTPKTKVGTVVTAPAEVAAFPAPFRLPDDVTPLAYDLHLRIDPAAPTFSGHVDIDIALQRPTHLVRLHALDLTLVDARYVGAATMPLIAALDGQGGLALTSAAPIPAGRGRLELSFEGPLDEPPVGLYRASEGERHYAYTQFEPLEARKAFPCFDEPRFKVPFTVTLTTPTDASALSNMPEVGMKAEGAWKTTRFSTSPPMPTYLVAVAVGPFDIVDGPKVSSKRVPFRVVTTRGKGHLARFALERTPDHLAFLEAWFGSPYPYPKLDFVAVPSFSSSAMENIGLVTYRDAVLLIDPMKAPIEDRQRGESIIAHELAHMWFGNLVTLAWWDDLWLNEAFAVWMARKAVAALVPELDSEESVARNKLHVMSADSRPASRAIREPIRDDGDIYNAFDGITYSKGASVLAMLEHWIGEEAFREGVRTYLDAHAHGIATTRNLLEHLETAARTRARRPTAPGELTQILQSFTDKPQVPLVRVDWRCEGDKVFIEVSQHEWRSLADPRGPVANDLRWDIPVCVRLADERRHHVHCELLDQPKKTWEIQPGFCPTFSHPNDREAGYYRWETRLGPISIARAEPVVMAGYLGNLRSSFEAGRLDVGTWLGLVQPLVTLELTPGALGDVLGVLAVVPALVPEASTDSRFVKKAQRWLSRLSFSTQLGTTVRERRIQPQLIRTFAGLGNAQIRAEAQRVTDRFIKALARGEAVDLEQIGLYLPIHIRALGHEPRQKATRHRLWDALERHVEHPVPTVRHVVISALGAFLEPELVQKSLGLVLSGRLRAQDFRTVRSTMSASPEVTEATWTWLTTHFTALVERLGAKSSPTLPWLAGNFCSAERATEVERWFRAKKDSIPSGLERNLTLVVDGIKSCATTRAHHQAQARRWFTTR